MNKKNKLLIFIFSLIVALSFWISYEVRYFNKVEFFSPVEFQGDIPIRNDARGKGEFGASRNGGRVHAGLDILAQIGTPVRAIKSGRVINAQIKPGLGKYVEIGHPGGFFPRLFFWQKKDSQLISIYAHLSEIKVKKGQRVHQGQIVGEVGKTGNASYKDMKPHLHFEIRKDGKAVNPRDYL